MSLISGGRCSRCRLPLASLLPSWKGEGKESSYYSIWAEAQAPHVVSSNIRVGANGCYCQVGMLLPALHLLFSGIVLVGRVLAIEGRSLGSPLALS